MFGINWRYKIVKAAIASLIAGLLVFNLTSCSDRAATQTISGGGSPTQLSGNISEVSPPEAIQELRQVLEIYQPQVTILSPQPDELLQDNTVTVKFQVQDLPIFKNQELDLGPHLHVILDNQPYIAVYSLNEPLVLPDLAPGTHTLRVFASRPWHESFKNEGAYAQTTFHIFTKTSDNNPDPAQPLLTYSRPKGSYGAEPILLDFYLTNAPLHLVAQENPEDDITDWRIRCTINGESFVLDLWEPIYLKGFKPGKNWVQLEFLNEQGNSVKNVFNNTARIITYEPKGKDTLSKLVRGELSAAEARGIVEPNYTAKIPELKPTTPTPSPTPPLSPTPSPSSTSPIPKPSPQISPEAQPSEEQAAEPKIETKEPTPASEIESKNLQNQKSDGFFSRFRRPAATRSPNLSPPLPEVIETPAPESTTPDVTSPQLENTPEPQPLVTPQEETAPLEESSSPAQPQPKDSAQLGKQRSDGFFNRFRRPTATPSPSLPPTLPELVNPPASNLVPSEPLPQPESSVEPDSADTLPQPSNSREKLVNNALE